MLLQFSRLLTEQPRTQFGHGEALEIGGRGYREGASPFQQPALSFGALLLACLACGSLVAGLLLPLIFFGLEDPMCPTNASRLATDSQSARNVSYNPEMHDHMKHVQRRHFFIRDMVESFEIEVPFVRTADNIADFFTKPMKTAAMFHAFRKRIMNELP